MKTGKTAENNEPIRVLLIFGPMVSIVEKGESFKELLVSEAFEFFVLLFSPLKSLLMLKANSSNFPTGLFS